jgi:hypothetical protein
MMARLQSMKNKRQLGSILMVSVLVATFIVVIVPLTAPKVKAFDHWEGSAAAEDGGLNDFDGIMNNVVVWANNGIHNITTTNYVVEMGYTLDIHGLTGGNYVEFIAPANQIIVQPGGKLITHDNGDDFTRTQIRGQGAMGFDSIMFSPTSEGRIVDCEIINTMNGVIFFGANLMEPGIVNSIFTETANYAVQMNGALNYTNIENTVFDDSLSPSAVALDVRNGSLNLTNGVALIGHAPLSPSMYISNANVTLDYVNFNGINQPGNILLVEGNSNGTVLTGCDFQQGVPGDYYVKSNGASFLMDDCTFLQGGPWTGTLTLEAHDYDIGWPANVILRNPINTLGDWDNSSIDATGGSSITLQWWLDVYVLDPDGNPIDFSQVSVSAPSVPSQQLTDVSGYARGFLVTELIELGATRTSYDPFNISALNNSMLGYADPQPNINVSKTITIIVPFNPIANTPPWVISVPTPQGVQFGNITIEFKLMDPDPGDDGIMYVNVFWSLDNSSWNPATALPGSQTSNLFIDTLYNFYWDSKTDFSDYTLTMYIRVEPFDGTGPGVTLETGPFEVDNKPPDILVQPDVTVLTNDTAIIEWIVDEDADASIWYGLDDTATMEQDSVGPPATGQTVVITGLMPGRKYTFYANSTDIYGNSISTYPAPGVFYTQVHIPLNKGWNLISLPPDLPDTDLDVALAPIAGDYNAVQRYDPSDLNGDYWKHNKVGKPNIDLISVIPSWGLWIHMINATTFIPAQNVPITGGPATPVPLIAGWNLVGYPSSIKQDVDSAMGIVTYDMVMTYDAMSGRWLRWESGSGGNLVEMVIGHAYYIHVPADTLWNVDYA